MRRKVMNMAKPRKNGKYLNVCIDQEIYDRLSSYCEVAGQPKTVAVERILRQFLDEFDRNPSGAVLQLPHNDAKVT